MLYLDEAVNRVIKLCISSLDTVHGNAINFYWSEQSWRSKVVYLRFSSTLILTSYHDLQTGWSPSSWRASCACPGWSSPDHSLLPTAAAAYAVDLQRPDWEVWGTAAMTDGSYGSTCRFDWRREEVEEIKRRTGGRNGADDPPPRFHSQSCRLQITRKWLHLMKVISVHAGRWCGINPVPCCMVTATVASWYSVGWNVGY